MIMKYFPPTNTEAAEHRFIGLFDPEWESSTLRSVCSSKLKMPARSAPWEVKEEEARNASLFLVQTSRMDVAFEWWAPPPNRMMRLPTRAELLRTKNIITSRYQLIYLHELAVACCSLSDNIHTHSISTTTPTSGSDRGRHLRAARWCMLVGTTPTRRSDP